MTKKRREITNRQTQRIKKERERERARSTMTERKKGNGT